MNSTIIYVFLGVILLLNLVFVFVYMKNKNKKVSVSQQVAATSQSVPLQQEEVVHEDAKTQALGSNSEPVHQQKAPQQRATFDDKTEVLGISNLSPQEKALIGKENHSHEVDATVFFGSEEKQQDSKQEKVFRSVIYKVKEKEETFSWNEDEVLIIGRDPQQSDLTITTDNYIGRTHALVYRKEKKYFLVDLDSKNGTYIDNLALKGQKEISLDQTFKLGQTDIVVR